MINMLLFFLQIYSTLGWGAKLGNGLVVFIRDEKIGDGNNIHPYQKVIVIYVTAINLHIENQLTIRKTYVYTIYIDCLVATYPHYLSLFVRL